MSWTVRADGGRYVPWRNGLGTTRELLRVPNTNDWSWRLSIATSAVPGIDRELTLLSGEALELRFDDGRTTRLTQGERARFAGEDPVIGVPIGGATEQLNLMWRRDLFTVVYPVEVEDDGVTFVVQLSTLHAG